MQKPSATRPWLFAALGAAVLVLGYSARGTHQAPPVAQQTRRQRTAKAKAAEAPPVLRAAAPADATFDRYAMLVSRSVFSPPAPPKPARESLASIPAIKPERPGRTTVVPRPAMERPTGPPAPPPLTGWSYVGYVVIGGKKLGIVANDSANTTENIEIGASFHGYTVDSVDGEQIVLTAGGSQQVLKRPTDFQLVPLSGGAPEPPPQRARP